VLVLLAITIQFVEISR